MSEAGNPGDDARTGVRRLAAQRAALAGWLREWDLDRQLRSIPADEALPAAGGGRAATPLVFPSPRRRTTLPPRPGEIWLLPPDGGLAAERPVYVVLLRSLRPRAWVVSPFGRFTRPATEGELQTRRRSPPLAVLCLWNRGVVAEERLQRGWRAGRLRPTEWSAAGRLLAALQAQSAPPADLARRIGPPLLHPLDPRHVYLEEERGLWQGAVCEAPATYRGSGEQEIAWAEAAEERGPYDAE